MLLLTCTNLTLVLSSPDKNSFFVRRRDMPALNLHRLLHIIIIFDIPLTSSFTPLVCWIFPLSLESSSKSFSLPCSIVQEKKHFYPLFQMWIQFQLFTEGIIMRVILMALHFGGWYFLPSILYFSKSVKRRYNDLKTMFI